MKVYKVSFLPVLVEGDDGAVVKAGRWMVYVTAPNPFRVADVVKHFLPELHAEGFAIEEEVEVSPGHSAWSVSIGPDGRSYSLFLTAPNDDLAFQALSRAVENMPIYKRYVEMGLFKTRLVNLDAEGVW